MLYNGLNQLKVRCPANIEGFIIALHVRKGGINTCLDLLCSKMLEISKLIKGVPVTLRFVDFTSERFGQFSDFFNDFFILLLLRRARIELCKHIAIILKRSRNRPWCSVLLNRQDWCNWLWHIHIIIAYELFRYEPRLGPSQTRPWIKGQSFIDCSPRPRG
jgi:hypothetical protein